MKNIFMLLFFAFSLILPGCAKKVDLSQGYEKISKKFLAAMRWKDYQGAATYLEGKEGAVLLERFDELKDLHIVEADYIYSRMNEEEQTAKSKMTLKYYMLPSTRIKEWSWEMTWGLLPADSKQLGSWQVEKAPPEFP